MIFDNVIFTEMVLPFLFVFVVVFAILQKSKILGEGKSQIDALVSLVIGLLLIGVPVARDIVVNLMPWLAVGIAVFFVFFILYGFVGGSDWMGEMWVKIVFGILAGLFVIGVVVYVTGIYNQMGGWFTSDVWTSVLLIAIIGGALAIAISTGKKEGGGKD